MTMCKENETRNLITALDIGTSKIVALVGEIKPEGTLEVIGVGMNGSFGVKNWSEINTDLVATSIHRVLEDAELMADCKTSSVVTGIAGSIVQSDSFIGIRCPKCIRC